MEAKSTDKKTFHLTENGQLLGELIYKSLFSHKAEIKLTNDNSLKENGFVILNIDKSQMAIYYLMGK